MQSTAKDTSAALRRHVLPILRSAGFDDGTSRKLWRHRESRIDHIELGSFSTYQAMTLGCPISSLSVRLGLSLPGYGATEDPFHKDHLSAGLRGLRPKEPQLPIRGVLCPGGAAPLTKGRWGWEFEWVWRIATVAEAEAASLDLANQLETYGLEWLERDWDLKEILTLHEGEAPVPILVSAPNGSHLMLDAGLPGSKIRNAHIAMAKQALIDRRQPG